jgi:hypothetical protein
MHTLYTQSSEGSRIETAASSDTHGVAAATAAPGLSHYHQAQKPFWDAVLEQREKSTTAKNMFTERSVADYLEQYPQWKEADLANLRDQFMSFDVNEDGLIDLSELSIVLDRLGDKSSRLERERYFLTVDGDGSDGVDFEEFLELVHDVITGNADAQCGFGKVYIETATNTAACNDLAIKEQLKFDLI